MRRIVLAMIVTGLLMAMTAAPAFAFHHKTIPAAACADEHAAAHAGGTVTLPGPADEPGPDQPFGTPVVDASPRIGLGAQCPAS